MSRKTEGDLHQLTRLVSSEQLDICKLSTLRNDTDSRKRTLFWIEGSGGVHYLQPVLRLAESAALRPR